MEKTKTNASASVHYPVIEVKLRADSIEIRELAWPDALHLYNRMMAQSKALIVDGQMVMTPDKFISALTENVELGTWLVLKSTGKDEAWLKDRSLSEVLDVAAAAAELNVGIIVDRLKKAKAQFQELLGRAANQAPTSGSPT
jgi:hypothetical protein